MSLLNQLIDRAPEKWRRVKSELDAIDLQDCQSIREALRLLIFHPAK